MSAQHTPGPWRVDGRYVRAPRTAIGDRAVCLVTDAGIFPKPEIAANAQLIAAAPDLFTALAAIVANHDSGAFVTSCVDDGAARPANLDAARAALAKAEAR